VAYFTASTDKMDGPKGVKAFAESLDLDYPILSDPTGATAAAYGIYNADRNIANRTTFFIGPDGKILAVESKVNTQDHGKQIAEKLKQLGVKEKK